MKARELIGFLMGLILFVILVPLIMWKLFGRSASECSAVDLLRGNGSHRDWT